MDRAIRSMPTFVFGVILLVGGIAVVVAELSPLGYAEAGPVAGLAGGAVVLVAAILAPRAPRTVPVTAPPRRVEGAPWIADEPVRVESDAAVDAVAPSDTLEPDPADVDPADIDTIEHDLADVDPADVDEGPST